MSVSLVEDQQINDHLKSKKTLLSSPPDLEIVHRWVFLSFFEMLKRGNLWNHILCVSSRYLAPSPEQDIQNNLLLISNFSLGSYISESNALTIDGKSIFSWKIQIVIAVETHFESGSAQQQPFYKMGNNGFQNKISFKCQCVKTE